MPFEPGTEVRVTEAFPSDFFDGLTEPPLIIEPGDALRVENETGSGTWPAFVLVVNESSERGWVPKRYLRHDGSRAVALRTYDTTTLKPAAGEMLVVVETDVESGWLWCRDQRDRLGWFQINRVAPTP